MESVVLVAGDLICTMSGADKLSDADERDEMESHRRRVFE